MRLNVTEGTLSTCEAASVGGSGTTTMPLCSLFDASSQSQEEGRGGRGGRGQWLRFIGERRLTNSDPQYPRPAPSHLAPCAGSGLVRSGSDPLGPTTPLPPSLATTCHHTEPGQPANRAPCPVPGDRARHLFPLLPKQPRPRTNKGIVPVRETESGGSPGDGSRAPGSSTRLRARSLAAFTGGSRPSHTHSPPTAWAPTAAARPEAAGWGRAGPGQAAVAGPGRVSWAGLGSGQSVRLRGRSRARSPRSALSAPRSAQSPRRRTD